ncbi:hypothetical protein ACFULT_26435 [Rhodococcus sp. NPDC057297]|uniref:FDXHR family putative zinc-binding protein n=1 Tax=Rhodococcus sp. NPDC057297 TaxID=3346090 RepID=UPI00362F9AEB
MTIPLQGDRNPENDAQISTGKAGMAICPRCQKRWGGMNTCHCTGCHTTFSGITAFDAHRRGGICSPPMIVGLRLTDRAYECYGHPADPDKPNHWGQRSEP